MSRIVLPVRFSAWLSGELGKDLQASLQRSLKCLPGSCVTMLPRAFLLEADEADGVSLERVHDAALAMEDEVQKRYPVFHHEMGPVWTGTLQVVFRQVS